VSTPNYALRRTVAVAVVAAIAVGLWRLGDAALSLGGGSPGAQPTPLGTGPSRSPGDVAPLPGCAVGKSPAVHAGYADWDRSLLDTRYRVPKSYVPPELVDTQTAGFEKGFLVRSLVVTDLGDLRRAAEDAGHPIDIAAAYRSFDQQASLFQRRADAQGSASASQDTARPGHSEHQLGTTVDFKTRGELDVDARWGDTPTGTWMADNAYRFGFVLSYPKGASAITCYAYEPWHFRYFGRALAAQIHDSGLTVREYLWGEQHGGG
jgi:D-alanyl-D-alanine carboxypeptidase